MRFIAVNDNYDSFGGKNASDELIIPFKNLINEAYCRDISVKVRTQLEVKRKSGQYIGAFAVYGYLKGETDKTVWWQTNTLRTSCGISSNGSWRA